MYQNREESLSLEGCTFIVISYFDVNTDRVRVHIWCWSTAMCQNCISTYPVCQSRTLVKLYECIYIYISKLIKYILASGFRCSFGPNWSLDPAIVGKVWHHAVNWRLVLSHVPPGTDDKNAPQISSSFCKAIIKKDIYEDMETYPNVHIYIYIFLVGFMKNNYPKIYDLVGFIPGYMLQLGWCCLNSSQC